MVIVSAKISKRKVLLGLLAAVCVILLLVLLIGRSEEQAPQAQEGERTLNGGSNEERLAFLQSYGWQVDPEPTQTQEVRVPQQFNEVFSRYNEMQREQGFDLSEYAGKTAKRYVYAVTNHPSGSSDYYATVLVYKNKIIGGDVTSSARDGSMHSFIMPS